MPGEPSLDQPSFDRSSLDRSSLDRSSLDATLRAISPFRRLHVRTTLAFGALTLALLGAMGLASFQWVRATELSALQARLRALAASLGDGIDASDVTTALASGDRASPSFRRLVSTFADVAQDEGDVESIYLVVRTDDPGTVRFAADWVRTGTPAEIGQLYDARELPQMIAAFDVPSVEEEMKEDEWGLSLSGYAPVRDADGRAVAVIGVDVTGARVDRIDAHAFRAIGLAYGVALLLLIAIGLFLGRSIRRPIERIVGASDAIAAGDLSARVGLDRRDELGILAARFDSMAIGLEERERLRAVFGRYVSEEVARRVLSSTDAERLGGEDREVSVLFIDIVRSSVLGELLEPSEIVEMLETYLGAMTELVEEHGGCVIEMLGDAILAVFNAPDALSDHPTRAVECGRAMKARLERLNDEWEESGLAQRWKDGGIARLRGRIGIHTGHVIAGNTGGETRMKYAVIGDTVNVAARVEALNEKLGTTLLVSAATHARLAGPLAAEAEPRGEHEVKGRDRRVEVFSY